MTLAFIDKIRDLTTGTGTGSLTGTGASDGYRPLTDANGYQIPYHIRHANGSEWEIGLGTVTAGVLSRDVILKSSNGNAAVSFTSGNKRIFVVTPADMFYEMFGAFASILYNQGAPYTGPGLNADCGRLIVRDTIETIDDSNSLNEIDLSVSNHWSIVLNVDKTLTVVNARPGQSFRIMLKQTGSKVVTWFNDLTWDNGTTPTLTTTANKYDWYAFICHNTTPAFHGFVLGKAL